MKRPFSPDGRLIGYQSQECGRADVYVRPFSGSGPSVRVSSSSGGVGPRWCRDGRTVLYLEDAKIMAATLERGRSMVSARHLAFPLPFAAGGSAAIAGLYALAPDEQHVVMVRPNQDSPRAPRRLLVIPDWTRELQTKVASR